MRQSEMIKMMFYWPFGDLLFDLYNLAAEHDLPWDLKNLQLRNLEKVRSQMIETYGWLDPAEKEKIQAEFDFWMANDQDPHIDWQLMAKHKKPDQVIASRSYKRQMADLIEFNSKGKSK